MMISDFINALGTLFNESIFLIVLRVLCVIAAMKISFNFVRYWSPLALAFILWLAAFILYAALNSDASVRMFVRFEVLLFFGVVSGIGYACYERLSR
jgi:hypothetical protein